MQTHEIGNGPNFMVKAIAAQSGIRVGSSRAGLERRGE
jgi:hypothetical protein